MKNPDKEKNNHRWGFADTRFTVKNGKTFFENLRYPFMRNATLPNFLPFVEEVLNVENLIADKNEEIAEKKVIPSLINKPFLTALKKKFKEKHYSLDDESRLIHSHGQMTTDEVYHLLYYGKLDRYVDLVFFPYNEKDVEVLVALAVKNNVCLIPYGGGSSVTGALLVSKQEKRMVVSVDMRYMDNIISIDKGNLTAIIEAGMVGRHLEEKLNEKGFTMGHEPDSMEFSTLGGWIATNASGMKRNKYGNIEDIVKSYHMVTPDGIIKHENDFDRASVGLDLKKLFFGNEGNFGIVTQAKVKIHPNPRVRKYGGILFHNFDQGVQFLKKLNSTNFKSASVRLVDNIQFRFGYALKEIEHNPITKLVDAFKKYVLIKVKKFDPNQMCMLTLVFEGDREEVEYQRTGNIKLAKEYGGVYAGESNGKRGYILTNLIAYIRDFLSDYYVIGETFETTVPWDKINTVCEAARKELNRLHKINKIPGQPYISWRVTQLYHSDVCIYFTMGMYLKGIKNEDQVYSNMEKRLREVIIKNGGSISHHHGIGKIRDNFLNKTYSKQEKEILFNIKKTIDPKNIFGIGNNILNRRNNK